jgi:hypothetical protein
MEMKIKKGVQLHPGVAIPLALMIVEPILAKHGQELVITSMMDGEHRDMSLHYSGLAVDLRTWDLRNPRSCVDKMGRALGDNYDVVLEKDHIHLEYDPK